MEPFEARVSDKTYGIYPQENGTFLIKENGKQIGSVYPEPGNLVLEWRSAQQLDENLIDRLGDVISSYALGTV